MGISMNRVPDPFVVRKLADCIELLPKLINSPRKMPVVQEVVRRAFEQINSIREASARGLEAMLQDGELQKQLSLGKKYRIELGRIREKAKASREPVTSVRLSDDETQTIKDSLDEDETGIFEFIERQAADIAEWVKEHRHPRDAELFRSHVAFVCGESLLDLVRGAEVSPGVFSLELNHWETETAKPLCDDIRLLADEMESITGFNTEFVELRLLNQYIYYRDDSTIKRWKDRLPESQKELRGRHWFVNYSAFRLIALERGVELPIDPHDLKKRVTK